MELVIRATVVYWFLWLVVRGTGKRSLAELTPLDLLSIVVIGDFVQQGVTGEDMSITGAAIAVSVFVLWTLVTASGGRRWPWMSVVVAGEPVLLVRGGHVLEGRLKQERVTIADLHEAAREQGIASLDDVEYCVLETDGEFSFIRSSSDDE